MKSKKKTSIGSIVLFVLMGIMIAYALASIVFIFINFSASKIVDIFLTIIICLTFSVILYLSAKMQWGSFLAAHGRMEEAEMYNNAIKHRKKKEAEEEMSLSDKISEEKQEIEEPKKLQFNLKSFLIGLFIFITFGSIGSGILVLASSQLSRITGENYIKTVGTFENVVYHIDEEGKEYAGIKLVFYDEKGNKVISNYDNAFNGMVSTEGNKLTIYYNRQNPTHVTTLTTPIMLFTCGGFSILVSFLIFLLQLGFNKKGDSNFAAILVGGIFAGFASASLAGAFLSTGGNFFLMLLSGGGIYALACFGMVGALFLLVGIFGLFKNIFKIISGGKK